MRKLCLLSTLVLTLLVAIPATAQDLSNKGREFWLCFPAHVPSGNSLARMALFITSDKASGGTITVNGFSTAFSVSANQISGPYNIPYNNAYISEVGTVVKKGIHVKVNDGQAPVVVFAHIYAGARSEASLILPVATLGRKYYSTNFWQASTFGSKSQFQVIATAANTVVQYQLRRNGILSQTVNTATLANPGDVLQIQDDQDLTGSIIESIATPTASCNKIAVFSGSSSVAINGAAGCTGDSYDPLYQQCYPVNTWGKNFGVTPFANNANGYHLRVTASEDNTNVNLNGTSIVLNAGQFYPAPASNPPPFTAAMTVSADKPVSVAQYMISSRCNGAASLGSQAQGDPDMIILNPIEQSISDINIFSSNLQSIRTKYLSVYIKTSAAPSFRINNAVPNASFIPMPSGNGYSYLIEDLTPYTSQYFRLTASEGFNAITYGMGDFESYGYSAGTNVKDLYQFVSIDNMYGSVDAPIACLGSAFLPSVTFPFQPLQITWQFNGLFPDVTINNPVFDATSVVNGRTLYKYKLTTPMTATTAGTFPFKIVVQNLSSDGCGAQQELDYELVVSELPKADFNFTTNGCVSSPVSFIDNSTNTNGRTINHRYWAFGDGNIQQDQPSVNHTYSSAGSYDVKYTIITDVGCKADTTIHPVVLTEPPVAAFSVVAPYCQGKSITFKDGSSVSNGGTITKWIWNFGDGSAAVTATTNADQTHTYENTGSYTVTLKVETASGCVSIEDQEQIIVHPNPVVDFSIPNVCLPTGAAQFTDLSTISDGTANLFSYMWNFGDGSPANSAKSPLHNYNSTGPFTVSLAVTSNNGCTTTQTKPINTIYAEPVASFTAPAEVCLGSAINLTDQSTAAGSTVTQWLWTFSDGTTSTTQNPSKIFSAPGSYDITLSVTSAIGCQSVTKTMTKTVVVNPLPTANFTTSLPGCAGQDITFTNSSVANAGNIIKWTWNYGDGTNAVLNTSNSFIHNYTNPVNHTVTLQVETDKGCVSTVLSKNIIVNPTPVAAFAPPDLCVNDVNAVIPDGSTVSSGSIAAWQWNFGDAKATAGNPNTSTLQNPSHHYTWPGNYTAQLIVTTNAGCKDTVQNTITVNGAVLTPSFTVENSGHLCSNNAVVIKDHSKVDAGNVVRVEIFWDAANDLTNKTVDNNPATGKTYNHTYPEFGTPASKTYTIRYDIYSGVVCVNSVSQTVTLLATPTLQFDVINPVCSNASPFSLVQQVHLLNVLQGSGVFSGAGVSSAGVFNPSTAGSGTHNINYAYTGNNGCVNSVSRSIEVYPTPAADAGPDKVVLEGGKVALTPKVITNMQVNYSWSPPQWLSNPSISNPEASPQTDFNYTLTVTSDKGCFTTDNVFVKLLKTPVIPNIFSPNGDGIHDRWVIEYLESYPGCVVQIYNRYGQMIYQLTNYTRPWDGKINGQDAPIGTYYYIIDPKNGRKPITGYVDIIR